MNDCRYRYGEGEYFASTAKQFRKHVLSCLLVQLLYLLSVYALARCRSLAAFAVTDP